MCERQRGCEHKKKTDKYTLANPAFHHFPDHTAKAAPKAAPHALP
jgi:hypothetical protein